MSTKEGPALTDELRKNYPEINPHCFGEKNYSDFLTCYECSTHIQIRRIEICHEYKFDIGIRVWRYRCKCCRTDLLHFMNFRITVSRKTEIEYIKWRNHSLPKDHQVFWPEKAKIKKKTESSKSKSLQFIKIPENADELQVFTKNIKSIMSTISEEQEKQFNDIRLAVNLTHAATVVSNSIIGQEKTTTLLHEFVEELGNHNDPPSTESSSSSESTTESSESSGQLDEININELTEIFELNTTTTTTTKTIENEVTDLDQLDCQICFEGIVNAVLVPCEHTLCRGCADSVSECPFCRQTISQVIGMRLG